MDVAAPRRFKIPRSVLVVVYTPALDVLLIERADHPGYWQSVTGAKDRLRESYAATAEREVREETGIRLAAIPAQACRLTINPASGLSRVRLWHRAAGGSLRDRGSAASTRDRPETPRHDRVPPRNARGGTVYDRRGK